MIIWMYRVIGSVSLMTGTIGLFIPLLPTTVFILIAAWSFSKSNPTLHQRLLQHHQFGEMIRNWQNHRAIPVKAKIAAVFSITLSTLLSVAALRDSLLLSLVLIAGMSALAFYIVTRPATGGDQTTSINSPMT